MKKLFVLMALLAFTAVSCDQSQAPTGAQNGPALKATQYKDIPISGFFWNECCGEYVEVSGMGHLVIRDNGSHIDMSGATGTGMAYNAETNTWEPTGNAYTQRGGITQNVSFKADGSFTLTLTTNMRNANGCSFKLKITIHISYNANGDATAIVEKVEMTCE